MKTVVYSINGKYFLDFGIYISESKGLLDKLKPKPRKSYSWAEQHGIVVDLSKPKYEEREISLKGWIIGESWHDMKAKFDLFLSEFDKGGLARLLIEFGKELVYDVYLADGVELDKEFRDGKMYGLFTIKLKEPNPVKKVLKLVGNDLRLSFTSPDWMDINIDGINESRKDSISINKALQSRAVGGLVFGGRNLLLNSQRYNHTGWKSFNGGTRTPAGNLGITITKQAHIIISNAIVSGVTSENFVVGERYVVSFEYFGSTRFEVNIGAKINTLVVPNATARGKFEMSYIHDATFNGYFYITNVNDGTNVTIRNLKIEKGNKATDWTPAPEDVHYITIAGKIDEIVNLQTNAEIIWE